MSRRKVIRPTEGQLREIATMRDAAVDNAIAVHEFHERIAEATPPTINVPSDWNHGALLNVRNSGDAYVVTLYPEEADWRHPERALRFTNPGEAQNFVSTWYARESHDPRAW